MNFPLFYFGNISYWSDIFQETELTFSETMFLPKKSYCNRTVILSPNGIQNLSVPIQGGRGKKINYKDVKINYKENWVKNHLATLQTSYASSPFYEFYIDEINQLLMTNYELLIDLNAHAFKLVSEFLKTDISINKSDNYQTCIERYIPNEYRAIPKYSQVFDHEFSFQYDLSILDLIFNKGPESKSYLDAL